MIRRLLVPVMAMISVGGLAGLSMGDASATVSAVTVSPGPVVAGSPATVSVNYNHNGASLVVWVSGFTVSSWTGCRSTTSNRQAYEICGPSFSFTTAAAPAKPTSLGAYPLTVAFYNGFSRGVISYSNKTALAYLGDYYQ